MSPIAEHADYTAREPSAGAIEGIARQITGNPRIERIVADSSVSGENCHVHEAEIEAAQASRAQASFDASTALVAVTPNVLPAIDMNDEELGETLSEVDDDELEDYLFTEEEQQNKSDMWHEVNKDYLEEWYIRGKHTKLKKDVQAAKIESADVASEAGSIRSAQSGRSGRSGRSSASGSGGSWSGSKHSLEPSSCSSPADAVLSALSKRGKLNSKRARIDISAISRLFE